MKNALAVLLLLLGASAASAKGLVIYDGIALRSEYSTLVYGQPERNRNATLDLMNQMGVDYDYVPASSMKTIWAVGGYKVNGWNPTTGVGSSVTTYDWIWVLEWKGRLSSANDNTTEYPRSYWGFYSDSLTLLAKRPTVPTVFSFGGAVGGTNSQPAFRDGAVASSRDTSGVSGGAYSGLPKTAHAAGKSYYWFPPSNLSGFFPNSTPPLGGFRPLLYCNKSALELYTHSGFRVNSNAPDSALSIGGAGGDTVQVWERPPLLYNGATYPSLIFGNTMGGAPCIDTAGSIIPCEFDPVVTAFMLARLDSVTGGKVFRTAGRGDQRIAVALTIDGAFAHGYRDLAGNRLANGRGNQAGGVDLADSTVFKASMDSLGSLRIPVTFGVNADSISNFQNEIPWFVTKVPTARFSPQVWSAVSDTAAASGAASWSHPRDVFGRYRNRTAYGPGTSGSADTSTYTLMKAADSLAFAYLPRDRKSRTILAPLDDWSPKFALSQWNNMDSTLYAIRKAGYAALRINVQKRPVAADWYRGWRLSQQNRTIDLDGSHLLLVGQTGHNIGGSKYLFDTSQDSTSNPIGFNAFPNRQPVPIVMVARVWAGLAHQTWWDYDYFSVQISTDTALGVYHAYEDSFQGFFRASVAKFHCSDFCGNQTPPTRPGWWAIKSLYNQARTVNETAWPTHANMIQFVYPENLTPQDLR